ncbi:MAG: hypothetical protein B0D92_00900 [Spirochaeta sp. LUC14_002_19_P3]|nr:MAG: hypothetical protein B0D92_00900 [Spirochaeta sp. LUC14_002_19_P3]
MLQFTNDAQDIAATLENLGYTVNRALDASKGEMQRAVDAFQAAASQREVEVALFYYAGHGVEHEGVNYIIPVGADINDEYELMDQGLSVERITVAMERSRAAFNMVVMDACRDNPFFTSGRSSSGRGLAAMSGRGKGSMIVFATSPGNIAADGRGRNSPFTAAFIKHAVTPGLEVSALMRQVNGTVRELTGGKQAPWFNASYTGEVYLGALKDLAGASNRISAVNGEIAALENEIAQREKAIAAARSQAEKRRLEAEQQRSRAEEAARRMQSEQLQEIALRAQETLEQQEADQFLRRQMEQQLAGQRAVLAKQAQERRARLEELKAQDGTAEGAWDQLIGITNLKTALFEVNTRFDKALSLMENEVRALYDQQVEALRENNPKEPFESQEEYEDYIAELSAEVRSRQTNELEQRREELNKTRSTETAGLSEQLAQAKAELSSSRFVLGAGSTAVKVAAFNIGDKVFPMEVSAKDGDAIAFSIPVSYSLKSGDRSALREEYYRVYSADQSGGLAGELSYRAFELYPNIWALQPEDTKVVNLLEDDAVLTRSSGSGEALLVSVSEGEPRKLTAALLLESGTGEEARLKINGKDAGSTPHLYLAASETDLGTVRAEFQWPGGDSRTYALSLQAGVNPVASATPENLKHLGMAVFSGLPTATEVKLDRTTRQAQNGLALFTLPEGRYDYRLSGPWLFESGSGNVEIAGLENPLAAINLADTGAQTAAEISLPLAAIAETLPARVSLEVRLYQNDGQEAPMRILKGSTNTLLVRAPAGQYQLALSRSDDPYNARISPIHAAGEQRTEHLIEELPLSAHTQWERAQAALDRMERQIKTRKPRTTLGVTLLGIGAAGLGTAILSSFMGQEVLNTYNNGVTPSDFSEARKAIDTWNGAFIAGTIAAGVGIVAGTVLSLGPSSSKLEIQRNSLQGKIEHYGSEYQTLLSEQPLYGRVKSATPEHLASSLSYSTVFKDGSGGVDGLSGAKFVAVSQDGKNVYVAGANEDALAVFTRNTTTGALSYSTVFKDGSGGVDGLDGAESVAVSRDGKNVYVAGFADDALAVFNRE